MIKILTFVIRFLLRKNLSVSERTALVNVLIHNLGLPPVKGIITTDENQRILVQGSALSVEQTIQIRESAVALKNNHALKLIRDQVRFMAVDKGFLQSDNPESQLFYKAALWYAQEESNLIEGLAGYQDSPL